MYVSPISGRPRLQPSAPAPRSNSRTHCSPGVKICPPLTSAEHLFMQNPPFSVPAYCCTLGLRVCRSLQRSYGKKGRVTLRTSSQFMTTTCSPTQKNRSIYTCLQFTRSFGLLEEARNSRVNPCIHWENIQTPHSTNFSHRTVHGLEIKPSTFLL